MRETEIVTHIFFARQTEQGGSFLLLFYSGMRVIELLALNEGNFDFVKNQISITNQRKSNI